MNEASVAREDEDEDEEVIKCAIVGLHVSSESEARSKKELRKLKNAAKQRTARASARAKGARAGVMEDK